MKAQLCRTVAAACYSGTTMLHLCLSLLCCVKHCAAAGVQHATLNVSTFNLLGLFTQMTTSLFGVTQYVLRFHDNHTCIVQQLSAATASGALCCHVLLCMQAKQILPGGLSLWWSHAFERFAGQW